MPMPKVLGEREIIEIIWKQLDSTPKMPVPFGDDISAYEIEKGKLAVLKTDMLVGKTDVPCGMSLRQAARKAVVMNVSDFAAKGVQPKAVLVSLGLPRGMTRKDVEEIGKGLNVGARGYGAYVIGGDMGEASDLVISVSLFGLATKGDLMLRSGAKSGDLVGVTGLFGKTSAGLKILLHKMKAKTAVRDRLVESVLLPRARLKEGLALCGTGAVTSSIDSSDGLAWSLHEVAKMSKVGFFIDHIPADENVARFAETNGLNVTELTLYGGEEYELVVTVKPALWREAQKTVEKVGGCLIGIGRVTNEQKVVLRFNGEERVVEARGYEHFTV
jgi:thiamine-monophosphate kinase